jgi:hypothetical protein
MIRIKHLVPGILPFSQKDFGQISLPKQILANVLFVNAIFGKLTIRIFSFGQIFFKQNISTKNSI